MAEILADDFGGCLPIIFDDAFAYSDPGRIDRLQRMLDLAASRGLQVIVLTCDSADYAALGAKQHILQPLSIGSDRTRPPALRNDVEPNQPADVARHTP